MPVPCASAVPRTAGAYSPTLTGCTQVVDADRGAHAQSAQTQHACASLPASGNQSVQQGLGDRPRTRLLLRGDALRRQQAGPRALVHGRGGQHGLPLGGACLMAQGHPQYTRIAERRLGACVAVCSAVRVVRYLRHNRAASGSHKEHSRSVPSHACDNASPEKGLPRPQAPATPSAPNVGHCVTNLFCSRYELHVGADQSAFRPSVRLNGCTVFSLLPTHR